MTSRLCLLSALALFLGACRSQAARWESSEVPPFVPALGSTPASAGALPNSAAEPEAASAPATTLTTSSAFASDPALFELRRQDVDEVVVGPNKRDWELMLGGVGNSNQDFENGSLGLQGSIGYFLSQRLEIGARQTFNYVDLNGSAWNGSTLGFIDFHFGRARLRPFVGGSLGAVYGDAVQESGAAGLEGGLKWFIKDDAFLFVFGQYQFFFDSSNDIDTGFEDGQWVFPIGLGILF